MDFRARADIEAPIAFVFRQVSDFPAFERQAMRRGADVQRRPGPAEGAGTAWDVQFRFRGRERRLAVEVTGFDRPNGLALRALSSNVLADTVVDLIALSRTRTRMEVRLDLSARSLPARLLLQSLRLARGRMQARFADRVAEFAAEVQARHQRGVG